MDLDDLYRLLRVSHVQAQGIVDTIRDPLLVLAGDLTVISANPAFYRTFATDRDSTIGRPLYDLGNGQWNIPELRMLLENVIPKSASIMDFEVQAGFPEVGLRTMLISAQRLIHPDNGQRVLLPLDGGCDGPASDGGREGHPDQRARSPHQEPDVGDTGSDPTDGRRRQKCRRISHRAPRTVRCSGAITRSGVAQAVVAAAGPGRRRDGAISGGGIRRCHRGRAGRPALPLRRPPRLASFFTSWGRMPQSTEPCPRRVEP